MKNNSGVRHLIFCPFFPVTSYHPQDNLIQEFRKTLIFFIFYSNIPSKIARRYTRCSANVHTAKNMSVPYSVKRCCRKSPKTMPHHLGYVVKSRAALVVISRPRCLVTKQPPCSRSGVRLYEGPRVRATAQIKLIQYDSP